MSSDRETIAADKSGCCGSAKQVIGPARRVSQARLRATRLKRLLKNSRMPRCCQFSEDRKEPSVGRSRSATDKLGDTARAEKWRNPEGANPLGMLLRRSTDIYPKELARDMREFFTVS